MQIEEKWQRQIFEKMLGPRYWQPLEYPFDHRLCIDTVHTESLLFFILFHHWHAFVIALFNTKHISML